MVSIAAFANLRAAGRPGSRLAMVTWQPIFAQEWMLVIGSALMKFAKEMPTMSPEGPGMFGLSDPDRIRATLAEAGWMSIDVVDRRVPLLLGGGGQLREVVGFIGDGMLDMVLADPDAETRRQALDALRDTLALHALEDGVRLHGAAWITTATG